MKNKNLYFWAGFIVLALGLIYIAKLNSSPRVESFVDSALEIVEDDNFSAIGGPAYGWDFGEISMASGDVSHKFILENNGVDPIIITKVQTSCMCTEATLKLQSGKKKGPFGMHGSSRINFEVPSGEEVEVEAIFNPNAHGPSGTGPIERSIYIETNSKTKPKVEISFSGMVIK